MGDSARRAAGAAQVSKPKPLSIRTKWLQTVCFPGLRASRKKGGHYGEFVARFSSSRPFVSAARPNLYTSSRKTLGHISSTGSSSSQPCSLLPSHPLILSLPPPAPRRGGSDSWPDADNRALIPVSMGEKLCGTWVWFQLCFDCWPAAPRFPTTC